MDETTRVTLLILGLALGTFALRLLPLAALSRFALPAWLRDWLGFVPGAVLAASLAQALLVSEGQIALTWRNLSLLAALPAVVVAWRTRSVLLTMLAGMAAYAILRRVL